MASATTAWRDNMQKGSVNTRIHVSKETRRFPKNYVNSSKSTSQMISIKEDRRRVGTHYSMCKNWTEWRKEVDKDHVPADDSFRLIHSKVKQRPASCKLCSLQRTSYISLQRMNWANVWERLHAPQVLPLEKLPITLKSKSPAVANDGLEVTKRIPTSLQKKTDRFDEQNQLPQSSCQFNMHQLIPPK